MWVVLGACFQEVPFQRRTAVAPVLSMPAVHPPTDGPRPGSVRPAGAGSQDPLERIARLAQLRDSGALTNEEFEAQKAKLLAGM